MKFRNIVVALLLCLITNNLLADNLIYNGDFEDGNVGFSTDYSFNAVSDLFYSEGTYAIGTDPRDYRPDGAFDNVYAQSGQDTYFYMSNGSSDTSVRYVVWQSDSLISVTQADTAYRFEAYVTSLYAISSSSPGPELVFQIGDGTNWENLGTTVTFANGESKGVWHLCYTDGTFTTSGNYYIRLVNNQSSGSGNDFGIDTIYFGLTSDSPSVDSNPLGSTVSCDTDDFSSIPNIDNSQSSYSVSDLQNNLVGSTFEGGTLQASSSTTVTSVFVVLSSNGTIDTNGYDLTLDGNVTGSGSLSKTGTGTLTLSNSTEIDTLDVQSGELTLASASTLTTSSAVTVASSASMSGTGTVAGDVSLSGTIAPGNSIGTLNVTGDYTFNTGSEFELEIDNSGNSDLLAVTGDVTIENGTTLKVVSMETITSSQDYTFLTANDISGTFTTFDTALLTTSSSTVSEWNTDLQYSTTQVHLIVEALGFDNNSATTTGSRKQIGVALQEVADSGGNTMTTQLQSLNTSQLQDAYDQLSGEGNPSLQKVTNDTTSEYMGTLSDRMRSFGIQHALLDEDQPYLASAGSFSIGNGTNNLPDRRWGFWSRGFADYGKRQAEGQSNGYRSNTYGGSFGLDYQFTDEWLLGVTIGHARSYVDVSKSKNSTEINTTLYGVYGSYQQPDWYFDSSVIFGSSEYDSYRYINIGSINEIAQSDYSGTQISGNFETGLSRFYNNWHIQPYVGFKFMHSKQDSFTETGTTNSNLHVHQDSMDSYQGSIGTTLTTQLTKDLDDITVLGQLRGKWIHEYGDVNSSTTSNFTGYSTSFTTDSESIQRDSAVLGAGISIIIAKNTEAYFNYDATLNSDMPSYMLSTGFQHRW